jgi:DNA-directed RNA polymerase subunit RPC12/RpoP
MSPPDSTEAGGTSARCGACGGEVIWDARRGASACPYCGNEIAGPTLAEEPAGVDERDLLEGFARELRPAASDEGFQRSLRCEQCGAVSLWHSEQRAGNCSFCGSPQVVEAGVRDDRIPVDGLIPFAVDKSRAGRAVRAWLGKLWFRPSDLRRAASLGKLAGVYLPFWTFDAHGRADYRGDRGDYHHVTRMVMVGGKRQRRRERQVRWTSVSGQAQMSFDDVLVCAGRGLPTEHLRKISDWTTGSLHPYEDRFLQGFVAEDYSVGLQEAWEDARRQMDQGLEQACLRDMGGDTHRNLRMDSEYSERSFKHCLLPAWIGNYRYAGKPYRVVVNGQTGTVGGRAPLSWVKVGLAVAALGVALVVLWSLLQATG